ncbi:hypothetical protein BJX68DRAFT_157356 [Aspergillus pseudodeflectus]|uniref:Zn(2)-C6 fungal-type domain-containing protein n=1 Tax=Aspergillus pseudodeflectus TaxID=176178 RepID=A0ABR4JTW5_9EURO
MFPEETPVRSSCPRLLHMPTLALPSRISYQEVPHKLSHRPLPVVQPNHPAAQDTLALSSDGKAARACLACRDAKRRCDKQPPFPTCKRCTRLGLSCIYWNGPNATFTHDTAIPAFAVRRLDAGGNMIFPVPERKEMPMLLHSFIETFGLAPLPVDKGSLAFLLRTSWASHALSDPCSFHATMFSASAHLDAFRGDWNNPVTTYHYTMALRLIREKLAAPNKAPDEGTIACIPTMVFFSSLRGDEKSSQIHKKGLTQLLRARGGLAEFELDGFFAALIPVCVITAAIVFDSELDIPGIDIPPTPVFPPSRLVSAALDRAANRNGYHHLSREAIQIFEDIRSVCTTRDEFLRTQIKTEWRERLRKKFKPGSVHETTVPDKVDAACHAAAMIFFYLLFDDSASDYDDTNSNPLLPTLSTPTTPSTPSTPATSSTYLETLIADLKETLQKTSTDLWIRTSAEAITWISLVGAAASAPASADRIWFSLRFAQPVGCIRSEGAGLYIACWMLYDWLNSRKKEKTAIVEIA